MKPSMFTELTNILAILYPDELSIRRITSDAGINAARIQLNSHPLNNWYAVLEEANKNNHVANLLHVVKEEYKNNSKFHKIYTNFYSSCSSPDVISEYLPAKLPQLPIGFDWVHIKSGEFSIGLDPSESVEASDYEMPRRTLLLPDFWITRTSVTVIQFDQFVGATGYLTTAEVLGKSYVSTGSRFQWIQAAYWKQPHGPSSHVDQKGDHPVTCLSWYDALAFCQWAGARLPSEAEWEKAARGPKAYIYPWGNHQPNRSLCNFSANIRDTMPVGSFPEGASSYQVLDMAGNVWDWTRSLWGTETTTPYFRYPYQPDDGREDLKAPANFLRVARGGSWDSRATGVRATFRGRFDPKWSCNHVGFRVVWSPAL